MKNTTINCIKFIGILLITGSFSRWCSAQKSTTTIIGLQIVAPTIPLSIPILFTPETSTTQTGTMLFSRSNSAEYSGQNIIYSRILSQSTNFSSITEVQDTNNTELLFSPISLTPGKYYWKILATNDFGSGHFSEDRYFCYKTCTETNNWWWNNNWWNTQNSGLITIIENGKTEETIALQGLNPIPFISPTEQQQYSPEIITAYQYAYSIGITTMPTISIADLNGPLIRRDMAKMISEYATKVLNKKPDNTLNCSFADTKDSNLETKYYTKLACKLGLMGREADGKQVAINFNPLQHVSRAQFWTVFSRLLYGGENNIQAGEHKERYEKHISALNRDKIMKSIQNPLLTKELRGRVMTMMMRADKDANKKIGHASAK